jgi:CheY-like chemotaxis protein
LGGKSGDVGRDNVERVESPIKNYDPPRVLIVDDNDDILHVLRLLFELEGFEVVGEAANGVEASVTAMKYQPDFIVLDYVMPRLDGAGAAEILRCLVPDARIVAFSAALDSKPDWADAFLNKERIGEVVPLLNSLAATRVGS